MVMFDSHEYNVEELKSTEFWYDNKSNNDEEETDLNPSRQENLYCRKCQLLSNASVACVARSARW